MERIAFVLPDMTMGGAERLISNILNIWSENDYDVEPHLLLFEEDGVFLNELPDEVIVHETGRSLKGLRQVFLEEQFDTIHSVLPHANIMVNLTNRFTNIDSEIIYAIHSEIIFGKIPNLFHNYMMNNETFITPCVESANRLSRRTRIPRDNFIPITNPTLMEDDIQPEEGVENRVLFTGRLTDVKKVDRLIKALTSVDKEFELHITGKGDKREELEVLAKKMNVDDKIKFRGFVKDIGKEYRKADIFVMPSNYEGLNTSCIRALASGCQILITNVSGADDIVISDKIGQVVNKTPEELAEGLEKVLETEKDIDLLEEHSRNFTSSEHAPTYFEVLSQN